MLALIIKSAYLLALIIVNVIFFDLSHKLRLLFLWGLLIYWHSGLQKYLWSRQVRWLALLLFPVVVCNFHLLSWIFSTPSRFGLWCLASSQIFFLVSILAFLKILCLMALIHWNDLNLVLFDFFYILLSLFSLPFHILRSTMLLLVFYLSLRVFWGWVSLLLVVWFWLGSYVLLRLCFGSVLWSNVGRYIEHIILFIFPAM